MTDHAVKSAYRGKYLGWTNRRTLRQRILRVAHGSLLPAGDEQHELLPDGVTPDQTYDAAHRLQTGEELRVAGTWILDFMDDISFPSVAASRTEDTMTITAVGQVYLHSV